MGRPSPNKAETPAVRSSQPCLVDLHSQAPRSKPLSVPLQTVPAQLPSGLPDGSQRGHTVPPFPPTGVCSKHHPGGCSEKLQPPYAPSQGSPPSFPESHTRSVAGLSSCFGVQMHKERAISNSWPQLQVQGEPLMGNGLVSQASVTSVRSFCDSLKRETLGPTPGQGQAPSTLARVGVGMLSGTTGCPPVSETWPWR